MSGKSRGEAKERMGRVLASIKSMKGASGYGNE